MDQQTTTHKKNPPSCVSCKQRKIKCDRASPCSNCVRSNTQCVVPPPSRTPRGRNGGRRRKADTELLERIANLEGIVKKLEGPADEADTATTPGEAFKDPNSRISRLPPEQKPPTDGLERYLGGSLFLDLSDEIHGLRDVLNQSSGDEEEDEEASSDPDSSIQPNLVIPATAGFEIQPPTSSQMQELFLTYMLNVDPTVKILHAPSLRRYLFEGSARLECSQGSRGLNALRCAIFYISVTSLTPEDCLHRLSEEKFVLLSRFRRGTETALANIDFVNTEDISTLQALVLYLFATRNNDSSRRTWTLTGLAVRIAQALGLHREYRTNLPLLQRESRRRLWWVICALDRNSSNDRGSDPIITTDSFNTKLPLNVNDTDLDLSAAQDVQSREEFTEMTLPLLIHELLDLERRVNSVPAGKSTNIPLTGGDPWAERKRWVTERYQHVQNKYLRHCDTKVPVQRFAKRLVDIMIAQAWLYVYRPLHKDPDDPPLVCIPPPGILRLAVEVLEKAMEFSQGGPVTARFQWMSDIWVHWHALAVMIAELCVQKEGPIVERAWKIHGLFYDEVAQKIADSHRGRLWRPIKKMNNMALAVRQKHLATLGAVPSSECMQSMLLSQNPPAQTLLPTGQAPMVSGTDPSLDALGDLEPPSQPLQWDPVASEPSPFDWSSWVQAGSSDQIQYGTELNDLAWMNWETFMSEYQNHGDQSAVTPPDFPMLY